MRAKRNESRQDRDFGKETKAKERILFDEEKLEKLEEEEKRGTKEKRRKIDREEGGRANVRREVEMDNKKVRQ